METIGARSAKLNKILTMRVCAEDFPTYVHAAYVCKIVKGLEAVSMLDADIRLAWIERAERLAAAADLVKWLEYRHGFVEYMAPKG